MSAASKVMDVGLGIIVTVILMAISLYFIAYTLPAALTTLSTAAFTSVNGGVIAIFQTIIPITVGFVFVMAYIGVVRTIFTSI